MPQDMPPVGGYNAVQYKRNLPARGFRPGILLLGMGAVMGYGWYKLIKGIREANELAREKISADGTPIRRARRSCWARTRVCTTRTGLSDPRSLLRRRRRNRREAGSGQETWGNRKEEEPYRARSR
ncbi:NADH dehydrogenase [ubiquinone] 1 alpha subcomplex subunit 13 like protein [Verticillium longisporum]|nr:NADH dehydrogenase [ubiquinone] 1 alpha subcomplex subunit 13 like protein [Verticillium longisporum]